jgi:hypothetical protein
MPNNEELGNELAKTLLKQCIEKGYVINIDNLAVEPDHVNKRVKLSPSPVAIAAEVLKALEEIKETLRRRRDNGGGRSVNATGLINHIDDVAERYKEKNGNNT